MSSPLINKTKKLKLSEEVISATGFFDRLKGLLGKKTFCSKKAFFIKNCKSIHTFFMMFPIDVVFVNKDLVVESIHKRVPPYRLLLPGNLRVAHVFEFLEGTLNEENLSQGDQLHVGD